MISIIKKAFTHILTAIAVGCLTLLGAAGFMDNKVVYQIPRSGKSIDTMVIDGRDKNLPAMPSHAGDKVNWKAFRNDSQPARSNRPCWLRSHAPFSSHGQCHSTGLHSNRWFDCSSCDSRSCRGSKQMGLF